MIERKHWHPNITDEMVINAAQRQMRDLDDPGFCLMCGNEQGGCEPDARRIKCEACGAKHVYGASELMWHLDDDSPAFKAVESTAIWPTGNSSGD